jgi:hypothetical protein
MKITKDIEAFSFISEALLKQNEKSMGISDECAYRGFSESLRNEISSMSDINIHALSEEEEDDIYEYYELMRNMLAESLPDLKCAVGHIISDSWYDSDIENNDVSMPSVLSAVENSNPDWNITGSSIAMLKALQRVHDSRHVSDWDSFFKMFTFTEDGIYINTDILT